MQHYQYIEGSTPLLISMPHAGTFIPANIASSMTDKALLLPDTDWHVDRLYKFASGLGAGLLSATYSRYVIDLNRPPDGQVLYPGTDNTELCPTRLFDNSPIYQRGSEPQSQEIKQRLYQYWQPYHQKLSEELQSLKQQYGIALLYEAHTIRSRVPRFFTGQLPDLNLGTGKGITADIKLERSLNDICKNANGYTSTLNGRFTGGYITRHYGNPRHGIHAVQLELTQCTYMDEQPPFLFNPALAEKIQSVLKQLLLTMLQWAKQSA